MCKLLITLALWGWLIRLSYIAIVIGFRCCCTVFFWLMYRFFLDGVSVFAATGTWDLGLKKRKVPGTWDLGHGTWDQGPGTWDTGAGT